jgi:hypothetical protein
MMAEEETLPLAPASGGTRKGRRCGRRSDLANSQVPKYMAEEAEPRMTAERPR